MRTHNIIIRSVFVMGFMAMGCGFLSTGPTQRGEEPETRGEEVMLIDDFSKKSGESSIGTVWEMFTDKVMGGVSAGSYTFEEIGGRRCLRLRGNVSLENRGGFIQAALPLEINKKPIDATAYAGVRIMVRGNGEQYFIHLRTGRTLLPWQYYQSGFKADEEWRTIEIPFGRFQPERLKGAFNPKRLKRIAVVAAEKAYQADVALARIEFYSASSE